MLCVIKSKACKKCGGDLSLECDIYGVYIQCIQCGANCNENDINLKPKDIETILKAGKARRPAPEAPVQKISAPAAARRLVVPYPKKPETLAVKSDIQNGAAATVRRSSRFPAP